MSKQLKINVQLFDKKTNENRSSGNLPDLGNLDFFATLKFYHFLNCQLGQPLLIANLYKNFE